MSERRTYQIGIRAFRIDRSDSSKNDEKNSGMTHAPLGIRTVRSTSQESGLVTSPEGEGDTGGEVE